MDSRLQFAQKLVYYPVGMKFSRGEDPPEPLITG